jgi:hypothetical protein
MDVWLSFFIIYTQAAIRFNINVAQSKTNTRKKMLKFTTTNSYHHM